MENIEQGVPCLVTSMGMGGGGGVGTYFVINGCGYKLDKGFHV